MTVGPRPLAHWLFTQGFGGRRECAAMVLAGRVAVGDPARVEADPQALLDPQGLLLTVDGQRWPVHAHALVMLHKPAGWECSLKPRHHPGVLSLLPPPLRGRGVQPVGRLDVDTTGLLLFTDDGALNHRLTHPRRHVAKVYEVGTACPVDEAQVARLLAGVLLDGDPAPARATNCERTGPAALRMTLTEGRHHQVKRMLAAVGNAVATLHRSRFGALALPADLAPGQWAWVEGGAAAVLGEG
jgi:16S rRNA pseudouridine516 synthase